jgi:electron transport complex protein RnfB
MSDPNADPKAATAEHSISRRDFVRHVVRGAAALGIGGGAAVLLARETARPGEYVWQLDPNKCIQCGNCATHCVLKPSAVKCVHTYEMCGRCRFCFGYYETRPGAEPDDGAETQLCPVDAIRRDFLREPYYEYTIDEELCIGCGKCVKGCEAFGNGSLHLQVRHDRCLNCNECSIAEACPAEAFVRVPADRPYLMKGAGRK